MALKTHFKLLGNEIKLPLNYQELSLELNFDKDDPNFRGQVTTNAWELGLGDANDGTDGANISIKHVSYGNIFDGIPFSIDLSYGKNGINVYENVFDGYLDLPNAEFLCDRIKANSIEKKGIDWLNGGAADSFTFEYLATSVADGGAGTIATSDYVLIPYQLNSQANKLDTVILLLTAFSIVNDLITLAESIGQLLGSAITKGIFGVNEIVLAVGTTLRLIILINSSSVLIKQVFKYILQDVKYKAGMYIHDLCEKGADHLFFALYFVFRYKPAKRGQATHTACENKQSNER